MRFPLGSISIALRQAISISYKRGILPPVKLTVYKYSKCMCAADQYWQWLSMFSADVTHWCLNSTGNIEQGNLYKSSSPPPLSHRLPTQCFNCSDQKYLEALGIFLEDRRAQRRTQQWCYVVFSPWVCLLKGIFYRHIVLANICKSSSLPRLSHRPHATGQTLSPVCFSRYYCLR